MSKQNTAKLRTRLFPAMMLGVLFFGLVFWGLSRKIPSTASLPSVLAASDEYISYWSFDEGRGTTAQDATGAHNGTLTNGPLWQSADQCVSGGCLKFDGTNDFVIAANSSSVFNLAAGQSLTVDAWFRTTATNGTSVNGGSMAIVDKGYNPSSGTIIPIWFLALGSYDTSFHIRPIFNVQDTAQHSYAAAAPRSTKYSDGRWHHLTAILDANRKTMSIYVDGILDGTQSTRTYPNVITMTNSRSLIIGASLNGTRNFFNGYIDEVKVYKSVVQPDRSSPTPVPSASPLVSATPTPSPFVYPSGAGGAVCGASCQKDADCINPSTSGALTWCNPGTHVCENKVCSQLGKATTPGAACDCVGTRVCGQSCGTPAYPGSAGQCNDGVSECGFLTTANACSANDQNNSVKYCLPIVPKSGYSRGLCTGSTSSYLKNPTGNSGIPPLSAYDVFLACNGTSVFATPSPSPLLPTPSPTPKLATPTPTPLMCIAASCVSNTGALKYGAQLSCNVTPVSQSGAFYEGQCSVKRSGTLIQSFNLTPTLGGSPVFQPFTISHANATYDCVFRVCVTNLNTTACSAWGSTP